MSTVTLSKESHTNPTKFRASYESAKLILDGDTFAAHTSKLAAGKTIRTRSKITIVGGGFGGIGAALSCVKNLKEQDYVLFEKHEDLGGTWWANTYPGCASDIPAVWYSYYGEVATNWSDLRPPQYEMEEYIKSVVEKHHIGEHARCGTYIELATWDDVRGSWEIRAVDLKSGDRIIHTTAILANCTGGLVVPNKFLVPGLDSFKGNYMHSGIWDWSVDFSGKKVIVIGNGCSAAQVVPALLDYNPASITQLVRSQHYVFPPHPKGIFWLYYLLSWSRWGIVFVRLLIATVAETRYPMFTSTGYLSRFMRWINTRIALRYMTKTIPKEYHEILIPKFKIGCKRLIFDYFYAPSLLNPKIDVKLNEIKEVRERLVVLKDGQELEADIIVACTGYNIKQSFSPYKVVGRNGMEVGKLWGEKTASAYETVLVKNCPNYFTIGGPNSATGHSSVVLAIENACAYFTLVSKKILDGTYKSVCVKDEKYDEWFETTQSILSKSVFGTKYGGCVSWYSDDFNATAYPYSQITYYRRMRNVKWADLEVEKWKRD